MVFLVIFMLGGTGGLARAETPAVTPTEAGRSSAWDWNLGAGLRTLPFGGAVSGTLGYNWLLWGTPKRGEIMYGFIRPALRIQTSAITNRFEAQLNIHPISFFQLQAGHFQTLRLIDSTTVNCSTYACRGWLGGTFLKAEALVGVDKVVGGASLRWQAYLAGATNYAGAPFYDESIALVGNGAGERVTEVTAWSAWRFSDLVMVGAYYSANVMGDSSQNDRHVSLFGRYKMEPWTFTLGAGQYQSTLQGPGLTIYGMVQYMGQEGLELH
jgi:hypothetical protein